MTGQQPAVNVDDYVVARYKNGDEVRGEVAQIESGDGYQLYIGNLTLWLYTTQGWTVELTERPQPPLADGVYQKDDSLRFRRGGRWYLPSTTGARWGTGVQYGDELYGDWQYVGPEVSR